jgi:hypothetical protein
MVLLRRQGLPAPRPMPSRQVVLLTPLESSHPQPSPSSHRINLMNTDFPVVDPHSFQTLTGVHFATHLFSCSCRNGGGYTPLARHSFSEGGSPDVLDVPTITVWTFRRSVSSLPATFTEHSASVAFKRLTLKLNSADATLTKNTGGSVCPQNLQPSNLQTFKRSTLSPADGVQLRTVN